MSAKSLQSCPSLCDPIVGSLPGSLIPGILQARSLEWVAISFSHAWQWKAKAKSLSHVQLFENPWTAAYQAPLPMGFFRQEYWSGVPLPSPEEISRLSQSVVFLYFFALITEEGFLFSPCCSLELCIQIGTSFFFSFAFLLLFFSQLFIRSVQTTILPFCISFSWGWSRFLFLVQCHEPLSIVLQAFYQV